MNTEKIVKQVADALAENNFAEVVYATCVSAAGALNALYRLTNDQRFARIAEELRSIAAAMHEREMHRLSGKPCPCPKCRGKVC